jgi:hypothetical protein
MYVKYRIVRKLGQGLIGVYSAEHGYQLFSERTLRKASKCATCCKPIPKGGLAFGHFGNGMNRMHRVHESCMHRVHESCFK